MDIFHRHRQANEHDAAATALERALQIPEYRAEALVWKGIAALPLTPKLAFLFFAEAAKALPDRADIHALVGRSLLAQGQPKLATRYLTNAWKLQPNDLGLRLTLWDARSQSETPSELRRIILAHLPDIHTGKELAVVLKLLAAQSDAPGTVGVVRYLHDQKEIQGWAIDLQNLQVPASIQIEANGARINATASVSHPLLSAAGLPTSHGGLRVSVPNPTPAVTLQFANGTPLLGSPVYAMPVFVPPASAGGGGENNPVDVLIPVYNGLEETLECINSALDARKLNRTAHRLVVIEDKTPVPALAKALKVLAAKGKITLIQNAVNLGFIRTMNRAMALSPTKDVVWLNADTRVHGAWLDRLREVAYSDERIASVTPFTNNGELMSFPRSQICHDMPSANAQAELDELARQVASPPVEIETGCGFCLYIKREALDEVGYLDEVHLARGYGEETDWCLRARSHGWRHMGAPNIFVAHQGGISFGAEKVLRVAMNNATLRKRYPDASTRYKAFCLRDPIKPARQALQQARLELLARKPASQRNASWQKDTDHTLRIHDGSMPEADFSLSYHQTSHSTWVLLTAPLNPLPLMLEFELPNDFTRLVECLRNLPLQAIAYEHLARCPVGLCDLPETLDIPYSIQCRDDRLLDQQSDYDWHRFAREAESVKVPWPALKPIYSDALPDAKLTVETTPVDNEAPRHAPQSLMIGDSLRDQETALAWLDAARRIMQAGLPVRLLAHVDTPWLNQLQAIGSVKLLPEVEGFSLAERAQAAGCDGVLSLADSSGGWMAPGLASLLGVPLLARPIPLKSDNGATDLNNLYLTSSLAQ
ncbi:glycosyltransferase family 2 protein [Pseudomonas fulva]|uniref:glycosyltransferase family 2 protein n=1 Tax=Pseudomonas fulva TaxID=47880 RepID=UPI0018AAFA2E|nr:glycosyltransferase family 2 protein [Pseudomonas fulva]MBF8680110.1 glycosyltransferase [Pseudomonas fulva]MBF8718544.1 glycosyltransferase [Pseudomonas fulva]MBF8783657.1 glycosyltransferase [Pseudomonas fulva]